MTERQPTWPAASVYVAPAESLDEAKALLEAYGLLMPDGSLR